MQRISLTFLVIQALNPKYISCAMGVRFSLPWLCFFTGIMTMWAREESSDTIQQNLETVTVEAKSIPPKRLLDDGTVIMNKRGLSMTARRFGEADYIELVKTMAGVNTAGDYGSGLVIDGFEPSHTIYRINGAPVFFPYRFGGIFSTFNSQHFPYVYFERSVHSSSMPNRLGALLDFHTLESAQQPISGDINIGLLSSSFTISGCSDKVTVTASARVSYVDQLYGRFFKQDDAAIKYNFSDFNISASWNPSKADHFTVTGFHSTDKLRLDDSDYGMNTRLKWRNSLAGINWIHQDNDVKINTDVHWSYHSNRLSLEMPQIIFFAPSSISNPGISINARLNSDREQINSIDIGIEAQYYQIQPQWAFSTGVGSLGGNKASRQNAIESRIYGDLDFKIVGNINFKIGLSGTIWHNNSYNSYSLDPRATLSWQHPTTGLWNINIGRYTQNLHHVGLSEIGLASNFWLGSSTTLPTQRAHSISIQWSSQYLDNSLTISAETYLRRVTHQAEFRGTILDIVDSNYDVNNHIDIANGYNTGFNLSIDYRCHPWAVSANSSYGIALRKNSEINKNRWWHSINDAGFSCRGELTRWLGKKWSVTTSVHYSSGRRYTPVTNLYAIAGNLMKEYGTRNSARLPYWMRVDFSANYIFYTHHDIRHQLSLGLINAGGHRNVEMQYYTFNNDTETVYLHRVYSIYRFIPSISYSISF